MTVLQLASDDTSFRILPTQPEMKMRACGIFSGHSLIALSRLEASVYRVLARFLFLPAMSLNSDLKQLHFGRVDKKTFSLCIVASGPVKLHKITCFPCGANHLLHSVSALLSNHRIVRIFFLLNSHSC